MSSVNTKVYKNNAWNEAGIGDEAQASLTSDITLGTGFTDIISINADPSSRYYVEAHFDNSHQALGANAAVLHRIVGFDSGNVKKGLAAHTEMVPTRTGTDYYVSIAMVSGYPKYGLDVSAAGKVLSGAYIKIIKIK